MPHFSPLTFGRRWLPLRLTLVLGMVAALFVAGTASVLTSSPAGALGTPVSCSLIYGIDWQNNPHTIWQFDPNTGVNTPVLTVNDTRPMNSLAVDGATNTFWFTNQAFGGSSTVTIYGVNAVTGAQVTTTVPVSPTVTSGMIVGAIDPANGLFYFGGRDSNQTLILYAYNTVTQTFVGEVGAIPFPSIDPLVNNISDIAFDQAGHMYFTTDNNSGGTVSRLYVTDAPMPSTAGTANIPVTLIAATTTNQPSSGDLAFGADGYLYLGQVGGTYQKINPSTGAVVASRTVTTTSSMSDYASCATPSVITVQKTLPSGRVAAGDQFNLSVTGGGIATGNTGTTTGTETGLQNQQNSEIAGPVIGLAGIVYNIAETAAGTTALSNYVST